MGGLQSYVKSNGDYDISLSTASSGVQALTPIVVMLDYLYSIVLSNKYSNRDSFNELSGKIDRYLEYILSPVLEDLIKTDIVKFSKIQTNKSKRKIIYNSFKHSPKLKEMLNKHTDEITDFLKPKNVQSIIEEPEISLFPSTQKELMNYLVDKLDPYNCQDNRIVVTTHSPYILYSLNNCMLAGLLKKQSKISENVSNSSSIDPQDVSIYELDNGVIKNLQDKEHRLLNDNALDKYMGCIMESYYNMIDKVEL